MISVRSCLYQGRQLLGRLYIDQRVRRAVRTGSWFLGGFCFSAAALGEAMLPLAMAFTWASPGSGCVLAALGSVLGYWHFWGDIGLQGVVWTAIALLGRLFTAAAPRDRTGQLLLPAAAALAVAASGVGFQLLAGDTTSVSIYLLRIALAAFAGWVLDRVMLERNPVLEWVCLSLGVLALVQIQPIPYINLGFLAASLFALSHAFPAAALCALALDLAQVTRVPMTAVLVLASLLRFIPRCPRPALQLAPAVVYIGVMRLQGGWDLLPLPGLLLGGLLSEWVKGPAQIKHRRGETAVAQVRLEIAAGVLTQTQQLLLDVEQPPVDEDALIIAAADRACGGCPARHSCKDTRRIAQLPGVLLQKPLLHPQELPVMCRKSGYFLAELHRAQEQLRSIRADRQRQQEYRAAVLQQYRFLGEFLQELSDRLAVRPKDLHPFYAPQVQVCGNRPQADNGDRFAQFAGTMCKYYILLCDGMGTGLGAVQEGRTAVGILRSLLQAGFPAEHALQSLNSICALRDRAGAVTVDLAEVELYSGKVTLYKWGAAPSYLVSAAGAEKLGWAGPPPGLGVEHRVQQVHSLSLRRNQTLVMVSDGVAEEAAMQCCRNHADRSVGELARSLLTCTQIQGQDDATVITVRLGLAQDSSRKETA